MIENSGQPKTMGEKLSSIPRWVFFLLLLLATSLPLFFTVAIPNRPSSSALDLYRELSALPDGSTVIIQSDWTNSTRGESRGQFDALMRILMRKNIKFGLMAVADNQAPQVAKDAIDDLNKERAEEGKQPYRLWDDWVPLGYFPGAEGTGNSIGANIRDAFKSRKATDPSGVERSVFDSPVMSKIQKVSDLSAFIVVTGTASITIAIERLSNKVKMLGMVTGVMGPETLNYYISGQLKGLSAGLKGVYDMEVLMESGYNEGGINIPKSDGKKNMDRGTQYVLSMHFAIFLLIAAVVLGNIGLILSRRGAKHA